MTASISLTKPLMAPVHRISSPSRLPISLRLIFELEKSRCIGIKSDISFLKFRVSCSACRMNGGSSGGTCKLKFNTTCWL